VVLEELNPHLPFGNHLLGFLFFSLIGTRGFCAFFIVCTIDEGVQNCGLDSIQIWKGYVKKYHKFKRLKP
jgi:hypothetical protein